MIDKPEDEYRTPWIRWLIVLIVAAAGIAGIGVFHRFIVEPQQAVWNAEKPVHWPDIPLRVGTEVEDYRRPLGMVVERINDQVGCDILEISGDPLVRVIESTIEVGEESEDWAAAAWISEDGSRGEIRVFRPLMVSADIAVLWHELGHILGLAHDRSYAMRAITEESLDGPLRVPRFQDVDARALKQRYCEPKVTK